MEPNIRDRRVRKTRQLLRQGLVQLMEQKSIQQITVKELCETCDINRGTFYLHYTDVFDLLTSIENELLAEFENVLEKLTPGAFGQASPSPAMCSLFAFLADNADMGRALLCHNADNVFMEKVNTLVRTRIMAEWEVMFAPMNQEIRPYVYSFMVTGCIGMLQYWLEQGMPISPKEMALMTETVLGRGITALAIK